MISLQKITLEYKSTALFGFTALILSLIIGLLTGIRWDIVLLRSFILTVLFAGIGFGACAILKRFVPEVYDLMSSMGSLKGGEDGEVPDIEVPHDSASAPVEPENMEAAPADKPPEISAADEFRELDKDGLAHFTTTPSNEGSAVNTKAGKLGKHILETEKLTKYEPKIMAQAVRTMMSKDKE
jgi:hypothetical protein